MVIKVTGLNNLTKVLKRAEAQSPLLRARTLNNMAFHSFTEATRRPGGTLDRSFNLRNTHAQKAVRFTKATTRLGSVAIVGAVNYGQGAILPGDYLAAQEFGQNKLNVGHIPTMDARITKNQAKRVSRTQHLSRRNFGSDKTGPVVRGNRAAFIAVKQWKRKGGKGTRKMIISGKKGTQMGLYRLKKGKLRMIQNVSKDKVDIKQKRWLRPAAIMGLERGKRFAARNLNRMLKA